MLIPDPETIYFNPYGDDQFPKISIQRMTQYSPGRSVLDHWRASVISGAGSKPKIEEFERWSEMAESFDSRYAGAFSRAFPGAKTLY